MGTTIARERADLDLASIQEELKAAGVDGWLFYFFHDNDPLCLRILGLGGNHFVSRRWFYFVPAKGEPIKLVHRIEMDTLDSLPGQKVVYLGWRELEAKLKDVLSSTKKIAMQYSPNNAIPYISRVDAGTVELIRSFGHEVVSSADLVQQFEAKWSEAQLQTHIQAADCLRKIVFEGFAEIARLVRADEPVNEYQIQQFIVSSYERYEMVSNSPPIVAVNEHSGLPHYQPTATSHAPIRKGDFVLFDIWAKKKSPEDAIYGDITWTGYVGETVPAKYSEIFYIVRDARDAAVKFVAEALKSGKAICGWQVDDAARDHITKAGYGSQFVHRTGHSICTEVHANGANIDNLETKDERRLLPHTGFSIEPGIYLAEFGVRSELDVYMGEETVVIAGQPVQTEIVPILTL